MQELSDLKKWIGTASALSGLIVLASMLAIKYKCADLMPELKIDWDEILDHPNELVSFAGLLEKKDQLFARMIVNGADVHKISRLQNDIREVSEKLSKLLVS